MNEAQCQGQLLSEASLREGGVPVEVVEVAAIGGGLGSFAFVDLLRCAGFAGGRIAVIGNERSPIASFRRNCHNSQLLDGDRIRSNSDACPDNVWGFPGFAVREMGRELRHVQPWRAAAIGWQLFFEPVFATTYTPRLGHVVRAVEREASRIGWASMLRPGRVVSIGKTEEGRFCALAVGPDGTPFAASARIMHVALGHARPRATREAVEYCLAGGDRVVHAYEPHDEVYQSLRSGTRVVVVRGRGIVASRVLERLVEERRENPGLSVVLVNRAPLRGSAWGPARRRVADGFAMQTANWPKACFGGDLRLRLQAQGGAGREERLRAWGGTTTANRPAWRAMVRNGLRQGWLRHVYGETRAFKPLPGGGVSVVLGCADEARTVNADLVIDCTGFEDGAEADALLADVMERVGVAPNTYGRLPVNEAFEVEAVRHGSARLYASGACTFGGPLAPVDSFLGLQYQALASLSDLEESGTAGFRTLSGGRSLAAWWRWARGAPP